MYSYEIQAIATSVAKQNYFVMLLAVIYFIKKLWNKAYHIKKSIITQAFDNNDDDDDDTGFQILKR
jgi:hypothetical protein